VICITEDSLPILEGWNIPRHRCSVIENWAPLGELKPWTGPSTRLVEQGIVDRGLAHRDSAKATFAIEAIASKFEQIWGME
jgi:hypothetical protein